MFFVVVLFVIVDALYAMRWFYRAKSNQVLLVAGNLLRDSQ